MVDDPETQGWPVPDGARLLPASESCPGSPERSTSMVFFGDGDSVPLLAGFLFSSKLY